MKVVLLFFLSVAFIVIASKLGQYLIKKIEQLEKQKEVEGEIKNENNFKEVLKKENCSSTTKPFQDYNDVQNLTKFNHGTYRDEKGRFKSNKQWKKEHETS
jgi:cell division protein YceG involved in septum cleavage